MSLTLHFVYLKVERKIDPVFEHPVFDSAREKMKRFIKQLEKSQETFENLFYTFSNVVGKMFFLLQDRSGLLTKERPYSTSVEIATINGETDHATDFGSKRQR